MDDRTTVLKKKHIAAGWLVRCVNLPHDHSLPYEREGSRKGSVRNLTEDLELYLIA
jgi:hypothetical protein